MSQPVLSRPVTDRLPGVLAVVRRLFERLHASDVVYCHWKSNEHLDAAMRGDTDLDVLVDRGAGPILAGLLEETGYKRIVAVPSRAYAGVDDFIALDPTTGRLAHLHLHYRLVLGEKNLKGYRLPWESLVLASRKLDPVAGIFVSDPSVELVLLVVRAALKLRHRDFLAPPWNLPKLPDGVVDEFLWLVARVDGERLQTISRELVGAGAAELLVRMTSRLPSLQELSSFGRAAEPALRVHRTYGRLEALRRRWGREWGERWGSLRNRLLGDSVPLKHTLPRGGLLVAFVGSDGSGKSTVMRELASWLSWKVDVRPIYLGSGDGPVSLLRWPLHAILALRARRHRGVALRSVPHPQASMSSEDPGLGTGLVRLIWRGWWGLALAREKLNRLAEARRARNLGMIALCDRFPQSQFAGFNDGPQLSGWMDHRSALLRAAAAWELAAYRSAERSAPDLVVKLHVTPAIATQRKDDMVPEDLTRRVAATKSLRFPPEVRVVDIDATQPLEVVLLQVKRAIWEVL